MDIPYMENLTIPEENTRVWQVSVTAVLGSVLHRYQADFSVTDVILNKTTAASGHILAQNLSHLRIRPHANYLSKIKS